MNRTLSRTFQRQAGFTLIELLVVISIIGVLTSLLLTNFVGARQRGADAKLKSDAAQLRTALRLYYNDFQNYPASNSGGALLGCGSAGTTACTDGGTFEVGSTVYMQQLPTNFDYYSDGADAFIVAVALANASDSEIADSQTRCNVSGRAYVGSGFTAATDFVVCEN
jgi:type IV pilus assembly protein PilA